MFDKPLMVLLGAGASIPLEIPGMQGMAREFRKHLRSSDTSASTTLDMLLDLGLPEDIEEILQVSNEIDRLEGSPLGAFVEKCLSKRGKVTVDVRKYRSLRHKRVESVDYLTGELLDWIRSRCLPFRRDKALTIYGELLSSLNNLRFPIFTTNYDHVIEEVALRRGIPLADNFEHDRIGRSYWDPSLAGFFREGLPVVRLHGSILWHRHPDGLIEKRAAPQTKSQEGHELQPMLIFPTRFKDIYSDIYFPLYSSFTRSLSASRVLVVIGHSLRDIYLLAAIRERLSEGNFGVIVIDPVLPASNSLRTAIQEDRAAHWAGSIEDLWPVLLQMLQNIDIGPGEEIELANRLMPPALQAARLLEDGVSNELEVAGWHTHAQPGETLEVDVTISTTTAKGPLGIFLRRNKGTQLERLPARALDSDQSLSSVNFFGRHSETVPIRVTLPDSLERKSKHEVDFCMLDQMENVFVKKTLSLTIYADPA